jgi:hypothetical protein
MEVSITLKLIAKELTRVIVDSTVQEKAVAHPTDSKLLEAARAKVVEAAKANGIEIKQTYAKEGAPVVIQSRPLRPRPPIPTYAQSPQAPENYRWTTTAGGESQDEQHEPGGAG